LTRRKRIVVTGVGIFSSMGQDQYQVLSNMKRNITGIGNIANFPTNQMISNFGAEIKEYVPEPDTTKYNMCTQFGIRAAKEALKDSKLDITSQNADKLALCFGTCSGGLTELEKRRKVKNLDYDATLYFPWFQQGDCIAEHLGINGPVISNVTACVASGHSLIVGCEILSQGKLEAVLVGGSDTISESVYAGFNSLQALSGQPCAPFGYPSGLSLGEGAAFIVLESLERALERKAFIYAEICGFGLDQDAHHITAPHPGGDGVARTVTSALKQAKVKPEQIGYINVHGTGTEANDACELTGLRKALGDELFSKIPLNSSKAYFGHTLGPAAVIEIVSTLIAIKDGKLPATLHTTNLREGCQEANHILNNMPEGNPQYFLCNNSAFGGHNSSVLFKSWKEKQGSLKEEYKTEEDFPPKRVGIFGISMANQFGCISGSADTGISNKQHMDIEKARIETKKYIGSLYSRRMNYITQYCIAAAHLSIKDANLEVNQDNNTDIGLVFGSTYGALDRFSSYLKGIFDNGVTHASPLYFPDTTINTIPGRAAIKLGIKGYGTTISTGGNEGVLASHIAYQLIRSGYQSFCLVGAGDEICDFSNEVSSILGYDKSKYPLTEGSSFMVLGSLEGVAVKNTRCYGEIKGFGCGFGSDNYHEAIAKALDEASLHADNIDFVFYNDEGFEEKGLYQKKVLEGLFTNRRIPIKTFNDLFGYAFSVSSMYHIYQAALWLFNNKIYQNGLVVSSSLNGGNVAIAISRV